MHAKRIGGDAVAPAEFLHDFKDEQFVASIYFPAAQPVTLPSPDTSASTSVEASVSDIHGVFRGDTIIHRLLQNPDFQIEGLGHIAQWPAALRVMPGMILDSQQPMSLVWGPDRRLLYNAPYSESLGDQHPAAFGQTYWVRCIPMSDGTLD
ncbi:MAG: hypothetical protein H0T88_00435, partial [Lysobacter sp.]|nr:hypothetical protein [Lysobacter sp.]